MTDHVVVDGLTIEFPTEDGAVRAADGVSFRLPAGARMGLVGESGSGKTTTALGMLRLLRPPGRVVGGRVRVGDVDLLALEGDALRRARLRVGAYVPQGAMNALNPVTRIGAQFAEVYADHGERLSGAALRARVAAALAGVELDADVARRYAHELSGGMRQRVAIAIALSLSPRLIVADEPTSALDVVTQRQVMATLIDNQERLGSTLVLIGHDMGLMAQTATHLAVMYAGRLVEFGPLEAVFARPAHPYTAALIRSVPTLDRRDRVEGIPGVTPSLKRLPPGCAFAPRCPRAAGVCRAAVPPLAPLDATRFAACRFAGEAHGAPA